VRQAAGTTVVGSLAGDAAASIAQGAGRDIEEGKAHTDRDREQAIVAAFVKVQAQFQWDDAGGRWVAATAAQVQTSPFTEQLAAHPLVEDYDREVLTRLLAALVAADGTVGSDEREAFAELAPGADLDALGNVRAPAAVDFEEMKIGPTRETLLLLGWVVALSDDTLGDAENALLATAAIGLGIVDSRVAELKQIAQRHIIGQAIAVLATQGKDADAIRAEVEPLGDTIGLGADEAAREVIRWDRSRGRTRQLL